MRAFIAINLPEEIKDILYNLQGKLKGIGKVNWIHKKNLHLTLKFLGYIDEESLNKVNETLSKIKFKQFELALDKLGAFSIITKPRVIWISVKPSQKVIELQQKIDGELLNLFPKKQKFEAHITLGRMKLIKDREILKKINDCNIKGNFEVKSFELMESKLSKEGSKYYVLETYNLE